MGLKSIVIIVLAMFVVLLVGYVLGQRRKNTGVAGTHVGTSMPAEPAFSPDTQATAPAKIEVLPPRQKPRDYSKQIIQVKEFHERAADLFADLSYQITYSCFIDQIDKTNRIINTYKIDKQRNEEEATILFVKSFLDAANFSNIQRDLSSAANEVAKQIIAYYDEQVSKIFTDQPFSHLSSRYALNADLREIQIAKISGIIYGYFSHLVSELKEFEQIRKWLQSNLQVLNFDTSYDPDLGYLARMFGAGALTVINPLIGIPALIANYSMESKKSNTEINSKSAQIDRYNELLYNFAERYDAITEQVKQHEGQTAKYVSEKFREINVMAIPTMLTEVAANGYELNHYFIYLRKERNAMAKAEKSLKKFMVAIQTT